MARFYARFGMTPVHDDLLALPGRPDDDYLVLDHVSGPAGGPRVLLLHGLEGSSQAGYIQGLARGAARAGSPLAT